jgi:hypothetical protein
MPDPASSFVGQCPKCQGYETRIRSEVINYADKKNSGTEAQPPVASQSRVYVCNRCQHAWTEVVGR